MSLWTPHAEQALDLTWPAHELERSPQYTCTPPPPPGDYTCERRPDGAWSPPPSPDASEYEAFERDALRAMAERNGGSFLGSNPRMRRAVRSSHDAADDSYTRQRERNNIAAKQSRDRRKLREVRLAFQVAFLRTKLADLRARIERGCARCHRPAPAPC